MVRSVTRVCTVQVHSDTMIPVNNFYIHFDVTTSFLETSKISSKIHSIDFMVENDCTDSFVYMGLETGIQRRFFWFCISGFCVLIIYSQESTRRREGLLRKCIYVRLYITTSGQKYRIINYKISDWRPLDTSHEVGGWKKTAKYNENCKKRTQKKMKIQEKKDEILFLVVI